MAVNWAGLVGVIIFYLLILFIGLYASRKIKNKTSMEDVMLAGRNIGMLVGIFTMTATWVGGGFINGTAEAVHSKGLIYTQAPWGYSCSLILGGLFFAKKFRESGYVTMLDPFQRKFGKRMGGLLFLPALSGEVLWSSSILAALGTTVSVILSLDKILSIIVSACIAMFYTLFGGLYSVAYTDVVQLTCIALGLWLSLPFVFTSEYVSPISETKIEWLGQWKSEETFVWLDYGLLLVFGGIPWQVYFQRVLSAKTAKFAQVLSFTAGIGCMVMTIPSILIGAVATNADWNATDYGKPLEDSSLVLPLVLQYLTPRGISVIGLGAVCAAVMSSADSSLLSASSMFSRNIYKLLIRQSATEREIIWVMRGSVFVFGTIATILAITIDSIYGLFSLCSDFVYVILFPQLVSVVYIEFTNTYGSLAGYIVGLVLRLGGGEPILSLSPFIEYPYYDEDDKKQLFPFRTFSMLMSFGTLLLVSLLTRYLFRKEILDAKWDVFRCVTNQPPAEEDLKITMKTIDFGELPECNDDEQPRVFGKSGLVNAGAQMSNCINYISNMPGSPWNGRASSTSLSNNETLSAMPQRKHYSGLRSLPPSYNEVYSSKSSRGDMSSVHSRYSRGTPASRGNSTYSESDQSNEVISSLPRDNPRYSEVNRSKTAKSSTPLDNMGYTESNQNSQVHLSSDNKMHSKTEPSNTMHFQVSSTPKMPSPSHSSSGYPMPFDPWNDSIPPPPL